MVPPASRLRLAEDLPSALHGRSELNNGSASCLTEEIERVTPAFFKISAEVGQDGRNAIQSRSRVWLVHSDNGFFLTGAHLGLDELFVLDDGLPQRIGAGGSQTEAEQACRPQPCRNHRRPGHRLRRAIQNCGLHLKSRLPGGIERRFILDPADCHRQPLVKSPAVTLAAEVTVARDPGTNQDLITAVLTLHRVAPIWDRL